MSEIKFDISFTPYTIDTYAVFTTENADEQILYNINEDRKAQGKPELSWDDVEWEFDHKGYVQELAKKWEEMLNENILDEVILKVKLDGEAYSPREYNFRTDNCNTIFEVNMEKLNQFVKDNQVDFNENHIKSESGFMCLMEDDEIKLHYYLQKKSQEDYKPEDYEDDVRAQVDNGYDFIDYKIPED